MSAPGSSVLELIDRICDRYEVARLAGRRPRIGDYLRDAPEAARAGLLRELLRVERDYLQSDQRRRWGQGERVSVRAYLEEAPSLRGGGFAGAGSLAGGGSSSTVWSGASAVACCAACGMVRSLTP